MNLRTLYSFVFAVGLAMASSPVTGSAAGPPPAPNFGPNVHIFNQSMSQASIQAQLDAIASEQVDNQFGAERDAILFEPGTYGSTANPLIFQVGYYTTVAGLGLSPNDVVINGAIDVFNHCVPGHCDALTNFWRSMSNLTINFVHPQNPPAYVPPPPPEESPSCTDTNEMWAVSQASPIRRVAVNGFTTFMDYCGPDDFASGGFVADSRLHGVLNGSQQQWLTRNSKIDFWTNGVWNQVFSGVVGAPAECFPPQCNSNPYTTLPASPVTREAPYLYMDASGNYNVFVPSAQTNTAGTTWSSTTQTPGTSLPISCFYIASPSDSAATINASIHRGKNLILTPGIYHLDQPIDVARPDSVILGLGMATLVPTSGNAAMTVASAQGMTISGLIFDAGPNNSPVLLQLGRGNPRSSDEATDPSALHDVFFRIGGASTGKATTALVVNSDNVILDNVWAWRADHGNGVGWTSNTSDTGVVVNGNNVTAYGLFVEHFQKYEVIWNGNSGRDIFFQNEMPYDVPNQAAWMEAPGVDGYAAFKVAPSVARFNGYGMGSYSFFNKAYNGDTNIFAERAFEVPDALPAGSLHDILTVFLDKNNGTGGIRHVVNETGGQSDASNADHIVPVANYP